LEYLISGLYTDCSNSGFVGLRAIYDAKE
jgi:hypothetical protein